MKIEQKVDQELSRHFGQLLSCKQTQRSLLLIQGLIESKTVNLWSCAEAVGRQGDSGYTTDQLYAMFIDHFQTGRHDKLLKSYFLAVFYMTFHLSDGRLAMDRTEWKIGQRWHNILVIGYICHDSLVPLVWIDLGKRKNSNLSERIELLDRLLAWWRVTGIELPPLILYADREFIGSDWFTALVKRKIEFVIRLRENQQFAVWHKGQLSQKTYDVKVLSRYLKMFRKPYIEIVVGDQTIIPFTSTTQISQENGEHKEQQWFLAANISDPENAAAHYNSRWTIETTFGHTKTKGLNLEDFNLVGAHKMEIMLGLVSIVYAFSIRQTLKERLHEAVEIKTYRDGRQYPAKSTFKIGLERIREIVRNVKELFLFILQLLKEIIHRLKTKKFILYNSIVQ